MTDREFLKGIRSCIGKVIAAREGRGAMSLNHAIIDALLTFIWYHEQYTGATRGSASIIKPILLVAFRTPKHLDQVLVDISEALAIMDDAITKGTDVSTTNRMDRKRIEQLVQRGTSGVPQQRIGAPTTSVLAPSVVVTGESNV